MQKRTVRRTVTAGVLGAAALGVLAIPAVANAETPDSIAALANTGSAGSSAPADPGTLITKDRDGTVTVRPAEPGQPMPPGAVPAIPLQPGQPAPDGVIIQNGDAVPGGPAHTIIVSPVR
ncbi:hypothetical protein GPX89_15880 [Nocardia sp. ET3-3]|uniref:Uncharacterized protein n=1 Tax=Nocardia terrae TaxID=2675851 RepID=A0A7K1UXU0_9NOCA|nr:hypothetical protein [Nocardia terrae]MVU78718.1 hypothetical protein [Nocardia terrae]